jgi:O-antigen/teichoic acid export membrane protein
MLIINIVGLILTPFILNYLTKEEFALFYIAGDLLMWLGLAQLGVSSSYNSRAAQLFGQKNEEDLKYLTSSAWGLQIASSIVILLAGIVLSFFVNSFFDVKNEGHQTQTFFLILVVASAAQVMSQVFSALLISAKLINIDNRIRIVSVLPKILFTVLFLIAGWKLVGLALANLIASITPIVISIYYVKKKFPQIPIKLRYWTKKHTGELLMNGIWFTIGGVAGILISGLDRIVIAKVVSLEIVASFLITQKLYFLADKVLGQIFNVTRPFMGQLYGSGSYQRLYILYKFFKRLSIFVAVLSASLILVINETFVKIWVGEPLYAGQSVSFFIALNFIVQFVLLPNRVILATTLHRLSWQNSLRVVEGILNLAISIVLGKIYGIPGVVLGSILSSLIISNVVFNIFCDELFRNRGLKTGSKLYLNYLMVALIIPIYLITYVWPGVLTTVILMMLILVGSLIYTRFLIKIAQKEGISDSVPLLGLVARTLKVSYNE